MQRREFLMSSAAAAAAAIVSAPAAMALEADAPTGRQLIELRTYHFASEDKRKAYEQFLTEAAIPAFGRAGVAPVGAFKLLAKDNPDLKLTADATDLYVVLPHASVESMLTLDQRLAGDEAFASAGRAVLTAPKTDPAFVRYESSLLLAFAGFPRAQAPAKSESRVAQLRIYESHNEERARRKIHMFNEGGEIAIFQRVGMTPAFFGQSLAGTKMPNLTYMLAFEDEAALKKAWGAFGKDPGWKKLSGDESYKDTVSTITNLILRPVAGSQI